MSKKIEKTNEETKGVRFSMQEVAKLLLEKNGINDGFYLCHINPVVKGGLININQEEDGKDEIMQSIIIALGGIDLIKVSEDTPNAIDASKI